MEEGDLVFSSPELSRRAAMIFLIVFNITLLLSILFNAPLEQAANPGVTPNPAKAPWYFAWLQELVASTTVHLGSLTISGGLLGGILVPGILLLILVIWPLLDSTPPSAEGVWFARERNAQNIIFALISIVIVILIIIAMLLRGPYWRLYWPGTPWPPTPTLL